VKKKQVKPIQTTVYDFIILALCRFEPPDTKDELPDPENQCCGSGISIYTGSGSRVKKIPDPDPHQRMYS
jgi:hypothetical protein